MENKLNAREMFEELGYKLSYENGSVIRYKRIRKAEKNSFNVKIIEFGLNFFTADELLVDEENNIINDMITSSIFKEELKAINKQIEELGWK